MLIASWPLTEFAKFLQLLSWIVMPVLLLAVLLTIIVHYRQSRKNKKAVPVIDDGVILLSSPDNHSAGDRKNAHVLLDHTGVIRQYQEKLSYHHARYAALHQDFKVLESKYSSSVTPRVVQSIQIKKHAGEQPESQHSATQSDFLQQQVNEQILLVHRLQLEHEELNMQLLNTINSRENMAEELSSTKEEIQRQNMVIDQLRAELTDRDNKINDLLNEMNGVNILFRESKHKNDLMHEEIAATHLQIHQLREQLHVEELRVVKTMEELQENRELLKKIQDEIIFKIGEAERSPVAVNTDPVN